MFFVLVPRLRAQTSRRLDQHQPRRRGRKREEGHYWGERDPHMGMIQVEK